MSKWFNINYLKAPEMGKAAGTGAAFGAIGDSLMKLGQIGLNRQKIDDERQQRLEDVKFRNDDFAFRKDAHKDEMNAKANQLEWERKKFKDQLNSQNANFSKELLVKQQNADNTKSYYDYLKNEAEAKRKAQEAEKAANISMLRKMYPQATKDWSDEEVFAYGNLRQKEKNGKKDNEDIDVPDGYMLASAEEIAPLVGKGIIQGEGFKKVGQGKYIIKKTDLIDTLKEAKTQIDMAQHAADFANDEQEKVVPDIIPTPELKEKKKKKLPEFKFKPGAYDESERDRFGYDGAM